MISKAKVKQLENKWLDIRNKRGGGFVTVKEDPQGRWKTLDGRLLTKNEIRDIREDCKQSNKMLIILRDFAYGIKSDTQNDF
jgi:hypothetical protein